MAGHTKFALYSLTAVIFCSWYSPTLGAPAKFYTGNDFYTRCEAFSGDPKAVFCWGYVAGAIDALTAQLDSFGLPPPFCLPADVTAGQMGDVVLKFIKEHPEARHYSAAAMVGDYPCVKK